MILYFIGVCVLLEPSKNELNCLKTQFTCDNKQCIDIIEYCNNKRDCKDGSDEYNCSNNCMDKLNKNDCYQLSYNGYCKSSYDYMLQHCKKSCGFCSTTSLTTSLTTTSLTPTLLTTSLITTSLTTTSLITTLLITTSLTPTSLTPTSLTTTSLTPTSLTTTSLTTSLTPNLLTTTTSLTTTTNIKKMDTVASKKKSISTSIIVILIICIMIIVQVIFIIKKTQNDNVTDNKSIVFDSVYNSKYCEENNGYLVPVNRNNILIVEAIYEDII